jgi:flavin-dependent dehydrogenase
MTAGHCDVLVIGGGPAGSVVARVLALGGLDTMLVDAGTPEARRVGESLPGAARPMLQAVGLLPWLEQSAPQENIGNLSSWGSAGLAATDFIFDPQGNGWHLDRTRFDQCLREAAMDAGAALHEDRLRAIDTGASGTRAVFTNRSIQARWVVDATGKSRGVARRLGATRRRDACLISLYAWGRNRDADTRSVVEAVPDGWWYTAGLPGNARIAALHVLPTRAASILSRPDGFLREMRKSHYIHRYCCVEDEWTTVRSTDATASTLTQVHGPGWIAVGDAAISFDPLSSQGLFNAIYTGMRGAQAILGSMKNDRTEALGQYGERLRAIRRAYRNQVLEYYNQEQRWRHLPFWKSRHELPS